MSWMCVKWYICERGGNETGVRAMNGHDDDDDNDNYDETTENCTANGSKINKSLQCEHWTYTLHDFKSTPQPYWSVSTVLLRNTRQYFIYWYGLFGVIQWRRHRCAETYLLDGWRFHVSKLCLVLVNLFFPPIASTEPTPTSEIIPQQVHRCEMKK